MNDAERYTRQASHLAGIVLGATALLLWLARATWRAALA